MIDIKSAVLEEVAIKNEVKLSHLLANSIKQIRMINNVMLGTPVLELKLQIFLKGIELVLSEVSKKEKMELILKIMVVTFSKIGFEISDKEAFVLYEIRDLGKFRLKDSKLFSDLEKSWNASPDYRVDKSEFKVIINELKNIKFIDTRRGSITLGESIIINLE